ncbi:MAG TPA: mechanosensitive ion channel [Candidatus Woesebacteria bacterium]|nr:mechanosensitive ion channel [Candidatus Woesebacteria bacterium]
MESSLVLSNLLVQGIKIIFILIIAGLIDWLLKTFITKFINSRIKGKMVDGRRKKKAATLIGVFYGIVNFIIWLVVSLMILSEFRVNIAPILASLGIAGLAVSMAAKDIIADFIAGIFILFEGQYYVGDRIKIIDHEGVVEEITLRKTVIRDSHGILYFIPNSQIKIVARQPETNH